MYNMLFNFLTPQADEAPAEPIEISGTQSGTIGPGIYHVTGDILVEAGTELVIAAGTTIKFMDDYEILCPGQLQCLGNASNRIIFQLHESAGSSQWGGVAIATRAENELSDSPPDEDKHWKFLYCDFSDAKKTADGIYARSLTRGGAIMGYDLDNCTISNCTFINCEATGNGGTVFFNLQNTGTYVFEDSTIENSTTNEGQGGGFAGAEANFTLDNVTFINCRALLYDDIPLTASAASDEIIVPVTHDLQDGQTITFNDTGTLPSPLVADTAYYAIVTSSTRFKVASSYANAIADSPINLTSNGSGFEGNAHEDWYLFAGTMTIT